MTQAESPPPRFLTYINGMVAFEVTFFLFVIGSINDVRLSTAVYAPETSWAILLAAIGAWPAGFGLTVAGVFLVLGRNRTARAKGLAQAGAGGLLVLSGTAFVAIAPTLYLEASPLGIVIVGVALSAAAVVGTWKLAQKSPPRVLIRFAVGLVVLILGEIIIVNLIKLGWSRPRMRLLNEYPDFTFNSWWTIGSADMADALAEGIGADEFKSFPSGHTANAAVLMYLLPVLAWVSVRWRPLARRAVLVGVVWTVAVAASRIVVGAHFLTDVTVGFAVVFVVTYIVDRAVSRRPAVPTHTAPA